MGPTVLAPPKYKISHKYLNLSLFEMLFEHNQINKNMVHVLRYVDLFARQKLYDRLHVHLSRTQYRMHPEISEWPNDEFYDNRLINGAPYTGPQYRISPVPFGVQFSNIRAPQIQMGKSLKNPSEARIIIDHIQDHMADFESDNFTIGIICMYSAQVDEVRKLYLSTFPTYQHHRCIFGTVDGFQGGERDIVYVSFVRSAFVKPRAGGIGFLSDPRRLNVAATRAKRLCIFVGDLYFLAEGSGTFESLERNLVWRGLVHRL